MKKSLFGYGLTTKAIAKSGGWDIYDDKFVEISQDDFGNFLRPIAEFDAFKSELEIPSPGFVPNHILVKNARNLISEYDYFCHKTKALQVWISGTNGKTTTTKMTEFLLEKFGAVMGGNVGTPLAELDLSAKIWVLETSSFTLHYTNIAKPAIYALLPITPDHLSWHGDMQSYENEKLKPLANMREGGVAIVPKIYENREIVHNSMAKILFYENEQDLANLAGIEISAVKFRVPFLMDALMALLIEKIIFDCANMELLNNFVIEGNKLEEFSDRFGRVWVNDTKATNIDAAIWAVRRYAGRKIHLILGGDDKGVDLHPLFVEISKFSPLIYAIGVNTDKIVNLCKEYNLNCVRCEILEVAVREISKNFKNNSENLAENFNGEIAILSPACASLDQFKSYAQRGDKFKEFVGKI